MSASALRNIRIQEDRVHVHGWLLSHAVIFSTTVNDLKQILLNEKYLNDLILTPNSCLRNKCYFVKA